MDKEPIYFGDVVGDRIEVMRKRHRLTQKAAAIALGVDDAAYGEKCANRRNRWRLDDLPKLQAWAEQWEKVPMPGWPVIDEPWAKALGGLVGLARITGPHVDGGSSSNPGRMFKVLRALFESQRSGSSVAEVDPVWGTEKVDE